MADLQDLFEKHAASSHTKQLALNDLLGPHNWQFNMDSGTLDLGKGRVCSAEIIGTESLSSGTFLWAWANEASNIPPALVRSAEELKALGEREGIEELFTATLPIDGERIKGHKLAMIASGVCNADAYYVGPYEGGAAYFLIRNTPLGNRATTGTLRMIRVIEEIVSTHPCNHREMILSYLNQEGFSVTNRDNHYVAIAENERSLRFSFDDQDRMVKISSEATLE
jgi:hypothetical protein